jgi:hypothetical protein
LLDPASNASFAAMTEVMIESTGSGFTAVHDVPSLVEIATPLYVQATRQTPDGVVKLASLFTRCDDIPASASIQDKPKSVLFHNPLSHGAWSMYFADFGIGVLTW